MTHRTTPLVPACHLFVHRGVPFAFDCAKLVFLKLDEVSYALLERLQAGATFGAALTALEKQFDPEAVERVAGDIALLRRQGLLTGPVTTYDDADYERQIGRLVKMSTNKIELYLAEACNLRCRYCYVAENDAMHNGLMPWEVAKAAVDLVFRRGAAMDSIQITFFGGEPLLNMDGLRFVVDHARRRCRAAGKRARFAVVTNGSRVDEQTATFLRENGFAVTLSFDGPPEVHNRMRPFANGRPSFDATMSGANALRGAGIDLFVRCTVTRHCLDTPKLVCFFRDQGFEHFQLTRSEGRVDMIGPHDLGPSDWAIARGHEGRLADELLHSLSAGSRKHRTPVLISLDEIHHCRSAGLPCGVTRGVTTIDAEGKLYPCHRYVGMDKFVIGDIWEGVSRERQATYLREFFAVRSACQGCWARNVCEVHCPWYLSTAEGRVVSPPEWRCREAKANAELAVWLYAQLAERHPDELQRLLGARRPPRQLRFGRPRRKRDREPAAPAKGPEETARPREPVAMPQETAPLEDLHGQLQELSRRADELEAVVDSHEAARGPVQQLRRSLRSLEGRVGETQRWVRRSVVAVDALTELLVERGLVGAEELATRQRELLTALVGSRDAHPGLGVTLDRKENDKYAVQSATADCANRWHVCRAICCYALSFSISEQDVAEGLVQWDADRPYRIAREPDGKCVHLDREKYQCTLREHRPRICRIYDCRNDRRIWKEYDGLVLADWAAREIAKRFASCAGDRGAD